jgi:hypothetical protein
VIENLLGNVPEGAHGIFSKTTSVEAASSCTANANAGDNDSEHAGGEGTTRPTMSSRSIGGGGYHRRGISTSSSSSNNNNNVTNRALLQSPRSARRVSQGTLHSDNSGGGGVTKGPHYQHRRQKTMEETLSSLNMALESADKHAMENIWIS